MIITLHLSYVFSSDQRMREIQFYSFQLMPQVLSEHYEQSSPSPSLLKAKVASVLSASWKSCFVPCKPADSRLHRDLSRAFENHLAVNINLHHDYVTKGTIE